MAETSIQGTSTIGLNTLVPNFSVNAKILDDANTKETYWYNKDFTKYLGYYKTIPELKKAIDAFAMWTCGKGYAADDYTMSILEHITGWGKDTFSTIMQNMIIIKKINGDAYAEIIRDPETDILINLKPLNPINIRHVINEKGIIVAYDEYDSSSNEARRRFSPDKIFHLSNDRIASEIHGVSVVEACKWVIDARNEAMADKRRSMHLATIRVIEVDADDTTKYASLKRDWADAIKNGNVMIVPKNNVSFPNVPPMSTSEHSDWIRYLETFYYKAVGVPEIIMGGSQQYSEASSKVGHLTFEQPHETERVMLEAAIWNQLYLKVDFDEPTSLATPMQMSEAANTGQVGYQPNDLMAARGA